MSLPEGAPIAAEYPPPGWRDYATGRVIGPFLTGRLEALRDRFTLSDATDANIAPSHPSRWRRRLAKAASYLSVASVTTVGVIVGRMTGAAAHGLEDGILGAAPPLPHGGDSLAAHQYHHAAYEAPLQQAADSHTDIDLPADFNDHPKPVPIGPYHRSTGEGTIWDTVVEKYADHELGYGHLSERQKTPLVQETLTLNSKTWAQARSLDASYEPRLPTPNRMLELLHEHGAKRTHPPDLADPAPPAGSDPGREDSDPDPAPPVVPPSNLHPENDPDWVFEFPWGSYHVDDDAVIAGAIATAAAGAAYAGHQRARRLAAEAALVGSTQEVTPPVVIPAAQARPPEADASSMEQPVVTAPPPGPMAGPPPGADLGGTGRRKKRKKRLRDWLRQE